MAESALAIEEAEYLFECKEAIKCSNINCEAGTCFSPGNCVLTNSENFSQVLAYVLRVCVDNEEAIS
jgi:hypothetical protein